MYLLGCLFELLIAVLNIFPIFEKLDCLDTGRGGIGGGGSGSVGPGLWRPHLLTAGATFGIVVCTLSII